MSGARLCGRLAGPRALGRGGFFSVQGVLLGAAAALLFALVAYPLFWLMVASVSGEHGATAEHYVGLWQRPDLAQALGTTLLIAGLVGVLSVAIGAPLAWLVARSDVPFRGAIELMAYLSFIYPSFLSAIAYVLLLGPNAGVINRLLVDTFRLEQGPLNIFSVWGIVFVTLMHVYPFVFLLTASALRSLNPALEHAAQMLGAGRLTVARRVTLPLVAPAILSGALLAFVDSIALFGIQAVLGIPKGIHTLATKVYALFSHPPQFELASALSMAMVLLTVATLYVQRRCLGQRSYVTLAGKGAQEQRVRLGRWRLPALAGCLVLFTLALFLPSAVLISVSFMRSLARGFAPGNLTLENYAQITSHELPRTAMVNSFALASAAATIGVALGLLAAYTDLRTAYRGRRWLDYLALIPLGLPGIVLAVALIQAWLRPPLILYGTVWILLVAYVTRFLPFAVRTAHSSLLQVDVGLELAARIAGATWWRALALITLPLVRPGLLVGWILVFIQAMRELSASVLLYSRGNETLAVAVFRLYDEGYFPATCALATITLLVTLLAVAAVRGLTGRAVGELAREA